MAEYGWDLFLENSFYPQIKEFFDKLIEKGKSKPDCVFVFLTRSSFCLFLLMKNRGKLEEWQFTTYSDRYIMKNFETNFLNNKTVILVNDTITTGKHLTNIYTMVRNMTSACEIIPMVLAIEEGLDVNAQEKKGNAAFKKLFYQEKWSKNDILKFSSILTLLVYQEGLPYTIELPVLTAEDDDGKELHFSRAEFDLIRKGNKMWSYDEIMQMGYLQNDMTNGILILENHIFKMFFSEFILNMAVRVQINYIGEDIRLIFIPFAILKSVKFKQLLSFFNKLFSGTEYARKIEDYKTICDKNNIDFAQKAYVAIYRAVVYNLSIYIGTELKQYIKSVSDKELRFDQKRDSYHFDDIFKASMKERIDKHNEFSYMKNVISQKPFQKIECRKELKALCNQYSSKEYSYARAHNFLLEVINDIRHKNCFKENADVLKKMVTLEEVEELFKYGFDFDDDKTIESCITKCVCSMLNQGELINEVYYDVKSGIVYRGFRCGENSDAFYDISAKVFYAGVLKYYKIVGEKYAEMYDQFLMYLLRFFKQNMLMEGLISMDEFLFYAKYFRMAGENGYQFQIENKEFIIEDRKPYYVQTVEEYIEGLDFNLSGKKLE